MIGTQNRKHNAVKRMAAALLCLVFAAFLFTPAAAMENVKTVRVGWYESPFNRMDEFGRRSGYAYEYQRKVAAYTGWKFEYVEGNWADLLQMLADGEIDLLSDVSYKKDRTEHMLYTTLPMGSEAYYLYISSDNAEILPDDYSTLNGKRVGVTKNSIEIDLFRS